MAFYALLLGASEFSHCPLLSNPAFGRSHAKFLDYLRAVRGIPDENICNLFESTKNATDQLEELTDFLEKLPGAADLFVHYVGHGGFVSSQRFFLGLKTMKAGREDGTCLIFETFATRLRTFTVSKRVYVILDCCFAGAAVKHLMGPADDLMNRNVERSLPRRGVTVLAASSMHEAAFAPEHLSLTMFSDAMFRVLEQVDATSSEALTLRKLKVLMDESIWTRFGTDGVRPKIHAPYQPDGDIADVPIFPVRRLDAIRSKSKRESVPATVAHAPVAIRKRRESLVRETLNGAETERERLAAATVNEQTHDAAKIERDRLTEAVAERKPLAEAGAEQWPLDAERAEHEPLAEAEAERKLLAAVEAEQRQFDAERAERKRIAEAEATQRRLDAEATKRKQLAEAEAERKLLAAVEAEQRQLDAERAERKRIAEAEAKQRLDAEAAERKPLATVDAALQRLDPERDERKRLAEAEVEQRRLAEAEAEQRRLAEAEAERERAAQLDKERLDAAKAQQERLDAVNNELDTNKPADKERPAAAKPKPKQERLAAKAERRQLAAEQLEQERRASETVEKVRLERQRGERVLRWTVTLVLVVTVGMLVLRLASTPKPSPGNDSSPKAKADAVSVLPLGETWRVPVDSSPTLGPHDALVTIIEFADFQCPPCAKVQPTLFKLRDQYGADIRLVWKDMPLDVHPHARSAATVAREVLARRGASSFWEAQGILFASQNDLGNPCYERLATLFGLSASATLEAVNYDAHHAAIDADRAVASTLGVSRVPTFFLNGTRLEGADEPALLRTFETELLVAKQLLANGVPRNDVYEQRTQAGRTSADPMSGSSR